MKISNFDKTENLLKHLAGKELALVAKVENVEGKTLTFSPDKGIHIEVKIDNNKAGFKQGDKISINVTDGDVNLVRKGAIKAAIDKVASVVKESPTRGATKNFRKDI